MNGKFSRSQKWALFEVLKMWWPLAASWLLMSLELPAINTVISRLAEPKINLAAYGGVIFPLALIIESPIIMLLSASTALSKDWYSFKRLYKFMMITGAVLTGVHILTAFSPFYYVIARQWLGVPESVVEPGRLGFMIMVPWTWSIAYRRFHQGVLIRYGFSHAVGIGTVIRLTSGAVILIAGFVIGSIPGVVVGATAQAVGVLSEAIYAGWRARPVIKTELETLKSENMFTWKEFANFYIPLALTSMLGLLWQPLGSAALSRMPEPLMSLAAWTVVASLIQIFRSFGFALNEVVVAKLSESNSYPTLVRYVTILAVTVTSLQLLFFLTPASAIWFNYIVGLPPDLADSARRAFAIAIPMAALTVLQSWWQGSIVVERKTRAIPESMAVFLIVFICTAIYGINQTVVPGLFIGMAGFVLANLAQVIWLSLRSRPIMIKFYLRDSQGEEN